MRQVRSSWTMLSLSAALLPAVAAAQAPAPAGYAPAPAGYATAPTQIVGQDGRVMTLPAMAQPAAAPAPAAASHNHKHRGRTLCAACARKEQMAMGERIIACAHSKNGVCPSCQALLAMPGAITVGAPAAGEAPGRAVASNMPAPGAGNPAMMAARSGAMPAVYDPSSTPEPTPIGVMQTTYAQPGAMPAAPSSVPTATSMQPGHAVAESMGASPAPFQQKPTSSRNPKVIGHLLGFSGLGAEFREQRAQRKSEAHASIPYNNDGTTVNEIPASMVYGRR